MKSILTGMITMGRVIYYQYFHGIISNQHGTLLNNLSHF